MKNLIILIGFLTSLESMAQRIDIQGHRGARGLLPENTLPAFIRALDCGVTTLELDLAISKDGKVVVSHEPYLNHKICLAPDGRTISEAEGKKFNLYRMDYEEIEKCDCGSLGNDRFPGQKAMKVAKPLLEDVFKEAEKHIKSTSKYEVDYNIEIKCSPTSDNIYHPVPSEFSDIVHSLIAQYIPFERVVIQSFDFRVLQYWHEKYPEVRLAALVENKLSISDNLKNLGFYPQIYSPYFKQLNKKKVALLKQKDIMVIPWTVNETKHMTKLVAWGVDGIITDYPDRAQKAGLTIK